VELRLQGEENPVRSAALLLMVFSIFAASTLLAYSYPQASQVTVVNLPVRPWRVEVLGEFLC